MCPRFVIILQRHDTKKGFLLLWSEYILKDTKVREQRGDGNEKEQKSSIIKFHARLNKEVEIAIFSCLSRFLHLKEQKRHRKRLKFAFPLQCVDRRKEKNNNNNGIVSQ